MRKKIEYLVILLFLIGIIFAAGKLSNYVSGESVQKKADEKTILLDSGHGGRDPGKVGVNKVLEKDLNLQIAKKVKACLEKKGYKVVMTRETDEGLSKPGAGSSKVSDMKQRVALINQLEPPLAVSIHQNSYGESSVKGAQVFYYSHSKEGETAAKVMQEALKKLDAKNNRQAKANDTYYLLRKTKVPTIIVESGFLSNPEEALKLADEAYQNQIAEAVTEGVISYLNSKK